MSELTDVKELLQDLARGAADAVAVETREGYYHVTAVDERSLKRPLNSYRNRALGISVRTDDGTRYIIREEGGWLAFARWDRRNKADYYGERIEILNAFKGDEGRVFFVGSLRKRLGVR